MKKVVPAIILHIILAAGVIVSVFPFIWTFIASTHTDSQVLNFAYTFVLGSNFMNNLQGLHDEMPIWNNLFNSIYITGVYTVGVLLIDSMAGYAFAKYNFRFKNVIFFACLITMMIPQQVTMAPLFIQLTSFHWLDTPLAIIVPGLAGVFGVFLMRQNMSTFPDSLIEAARIDGASEKRIFFTIIVPSMKSAFAALGIISFVNQWGNYLWPLIALNSQKNFTMPLVLSILSQPNYVIHYGQLMVGAVLVLIPVMIFFLIFQKNFINGMMSGAIKG